MGEVWKPIEGTEGLYEVSSHGRVRSLDRFIEYKCKGKTVRRLQRGRFLSNSSDAEYQVVKICNKDGHQYIRIHQLVANAFVEKAEGKDYVNHKDANKHNNRADNLEWVTQKENIAYAREMGLCSDTVGEDHHSSKLTEDDVRWIRENDRTTNGGRMSREEMAKTLGVSGVTVTKAANRQTRKHID
ncbi:NUMOD4 domain-containing protein [Bacillus cereus]